MEWVSNCGRIKINFYLNEKISCNNRENVIHFATVIHL